MPKLSIIVPFVNEYPQVMFTLRNLGEELRDRADFEVIAVNNYCPEVERQHKAQTAIEVERVLQHLSRTGYGKFDLLQAYMKQTLNDFDDDKSGASVKACERGHGWLRYFEYKDKLSHWNAKRIGCEKATGDVFLFIDAHCIVGRDSVFNMFDTYLNFMDEGTLHLPLTYKILEWHRLIYKLVVHNDANKKPAEVTYSFTGYRPLDTPYEVPCMSTCGMMISRKIYEAVGGWPSELGIYGGGEHFMNYTLSVLGYRKFIMPDAWCCHHGEKRGYHWNYDDNIRNRILATYLFGGQEVARRFLSIAKGRPQTLERMLNDVMAKCKKQREHIKSQQQMHIDDWIAKWR